MDKEFPPEDKSISKNIDKWNDGGFKNKVWRRAVDFIGKDIKIFDDKIEPNDIK